MVPDCHVGMACRASLGLAALFLFVAGCDPVQVGAEMVTVKVKSVEVTLDIHGKTLASMGPAGTKDYSWPYRTIASRGRGEAGEWATGFTFQNRKPPSNEVSIRCFDQPDGSHRIEMTFSGNRDDDLGAVIFPNLEKIERVVERETGGAERNYSTWRHEDSRFTLLVPKAPSTITVVARVLSGSGSK